MAQGIQCYSSNSTATNVTAFISALFATESRQESYGNNNTNCKSLILIKSIFFCRQFQAIKKISLFLQKLAHKILVKKYSIYPKYSIYLHIFILTIPIFI